MFAILALFGVTIPPSKNPRTPRNIPGTPFFERRSRILTHLAQVFQRFALCRDRMPESSSHVAAVSFIFTNFKNDFAHNCRKYPPDLARATSFTLAHVQIFRSN